VTLYRIARSLVVGFCRLWFRVTAEGEENIPKEGAFVLAPVHRSFVDFGLVAVPTKRRMRYMTKDSMWKFKPLGALITALGGFPVKRGTADREALRLSMEVVKGGEPLVIFPEGTRQSGPTINDLFEGAAHVACRAGVPIVPVGVGGSERALKKGQRVPRPVKVHVIVGPPILPPTSETGRTSRRVVHEVTEQLQAELQKLFDAAQAKVGA
jgi:1-acyl-sn-glycerol-3-phosphate acyltransferase